MSQSGSFNSLVFSILISILYPASLYLWPNALTSDRHNPQTIKRNFISVLGASLISLQAHIWYQQWLDPHYRQGNSMWHYINFKPYHSTWNLLTHCIVLPMLHVLVLFAGPIYLDLQSFYRTFICGFRWHSISLMVKSMIHIAKQLLRLPVIRNLIVAPLTEELIFRGVVLSSLRPFWSSGTAILISSIMFGLMHTHHFLRNLLVAKQLRKQDVVSTLVQCTYTALFGAYASIAYIASGHIITPIVLHMFCNFNGLPNFEEIVSSKKQLYITIAGFSIWLCFLFPMYNAAM